VAERAIAALVGSHEVGAPPGSELMVPGSEVPVGRLADAAKFTRGPMNRHGIDESTCWRQLASQCALPRVNLSVLLRGVNLSREPRALVHVAPTRRAEGLSFRLGAPRP
jgi:hypothetical protein